MVVADEANDCVQLVNPDGTVNAVWGTPRLSPVALAVSPDDDLIVLNGGDNRIYRARTGEPPAVIAAQSEYRAARTAGQRRLAMAPNGEFAILDVETSRIRRYGPAGDLKADLSAGPRPTPALERFDGVATDDAGRYFLTRSVGAQVVRVGPSGEVEASWSPAGSPARPEAIALMPGGDLLIADPFQNKVDRLGPAGDQRGTVLGPEVEGKKIRPASVAAGADGTVAVVDGADDRLLVLDAGGNVTAIDRAGLGLDGDVHLGPVGVDGTGRIVLGVPDAGHVLRLTLGA
jgi:streptogramin lyase